MKHDVRFGLLGPFEFRAGGRPVVLRSARTRILLASLLLRAGSLVPSAELIEAIWGARQPDNPRRALHVCLVRARASLAEAGVEDLIVSGADGYRIVVPAGSVDVTVFRQWITRADAAAARGDVEGERLALTEALCLWRGEPLVDVPSDYLFRGYGIHLVEQHLQVFERRVDGSLRAGLPAEVIGDLAGLAARNPLRERLWEQYVAALHQAGRRSEAIEAYHTVRGRLVDELGIEPGEELRRLHATVLGGADDAGAGTRVPRQLPPEVSGFAGRSAEVDRMHELLAEHERTGVGGPAVLVINGMPGVGKTALAAYWSRRVADRFPDGQFWLDLRGYDRRAPATAQQSIALILGSLGVPVADLPPGLDEQVGLYRSVMDGRRVLLVLDNASGVEQILPLLPGEARSFVLITSRNDLASLIAIEAAQAIRLGPLTIAEARTLLEPRLGRERVRAEPDAVEQIIADCYGLPLALAIVAARAVGRPHFPLTAISRQLASINNPLDRFVDPGGTLDVRAVLSWSYRSLSSPAACLFRLLALHPTAAVSLAAAAALAGMPEPAARLLLDELATAHLINELVPDRFVMHDLLHAYAAELTALHDPPEHRSVALRRLLDWFTRTSLNARPLLQPSNSSVELPEHPDAAAPLAFDNERTAREWYESERSNLFAAVDLAYANGFDDLCWRLAYATWVYLYLQSAWDDLLRSHETGLRAAERLADRSGQAQLLTGMGIAYRATGDPERSVATQRQALALFRSTGDLIGTASALSNLCAAHRDAGEFEQALECGRKAYELDTAAGDRGSMAICLYQIGTTLTAAGRPDEAVTYIAKALRLFRELGHRRGEARGLKVAATAQLRLGRAEKAIEHYRTAIDIYQDLGDRWYQAQMLTAMGDVLHECGRRPEARHAWADALVIYEVLGAPLIGDLRVRLGKVDA